MLHLLLLAGFLLALPPAATVSWGHPLHTSLAKLVYEPTRRELSISLRVFADDFSAAAARSARIQLRPGQALADSVAFKYVVTRFALADASGTPVPLVPCGAKRAGELLILCLRSPAIRSPAGLRLRNTLLFESFGDQVNIVQYVLTASQRTVMFTARDQAKALR